MPKLNDNAFAVLGALPSDDRITLNDKADEAALLGGDDTEAALNQLMQMNRRIPAELSFLPGSDARTVDAFLNYAKTVSEGQPARIPSLDGLGSVLAQANALEALFEVWPASNYDMFIGLCLSMDKIFSRVTVDETLEAVNADRTAGKWETIQDPAALADPLNERLRELCAPLARAVEHISTDVVSKAVAKLFSTPSFEKEGVVGQTLLDAYALRVHELVEKKKAYITDELKLLKDRKDIPQSRLTDMREQFASWAQLTSPLRAVSGPTRNDTKTLLQAYRNVIVDFVNNSKPKEAKKSFSFHVFNGIRTVTVTYQSRSDSVRFAYNLNEWMKNTFPEQVEFRAQLAEDNKLLQNILNQETQMLQKAESDARIRAGAYKL